MGLFKRKKDEEVKIQLEREALDKLNSTDVEMFNIPSASIEDNSNNPEWRISGKIRAPHTITAEELNAKSQKNNINSDESITEEIPMSKPEKSNDSPSDFLYQKMMQSRAQIQENSIQPETQKAPTDVVNEEITTQIPATETYAPLDIEAAIDDIKNTANLKIENQETTTIPSDSAEKTESQFATIQEEKLPDNPKPVKETSANDVANDIPGISGSPEERRATLLARCNAYLEDDADNFKIDTEKYKLESVESILEGFEARAAERINKKFSTNHSSSTPKVPVSSTSTPSAETTEKPIVSAHVSDTVVFKTPISTVQSENTNIKEPNPQSTTVKHIFSADVPSTPAKPAVNNDSFDDISSTRILTDISSNSKPTDIYSSGKTSVFPVVETVINTDTPKNNETETAPIADKEDKIDFEDYATITDRPKILKSLLRKKRSFALKFLLSLLAFIPSLVLVTPIFNSTITSKTAINIIELIICLFVLLVNINTLAGLSTLFNSKSKNSLPVALSLISATLFAVINLIVKSDFIGFSCLAALSLVSYNLANRNFYSKTIKNFNLIATAEFKNAVSIIQNKSATKSIVGNSIEGSALVCYGGETTNIRNFLKYTFCKNPISGKIQKISLISVIVGFLFALATLVFNSSNPVFALYVFCATVCFSAIPSVYHIVSLTINSANKRLNHYDAMITGYRAADELELCNAVAISSDSLFPEGSVRLVDMKLLSPNPFDQSILDAAAIASAIHSPLSGIFKQMDASKAYKVLAQDVDTVIYEEKMGISGWVNDRRVFVGNRDLLIAHGFTGLPPAELDKKIMRKGYFPVYIASDNIPCALLVVKYEPDEDILYEMQRLANTGTTIIVDNCDPNISAQMLTDYFELYNETIFIMNKQGSDFYKALTPHKEHRNAGAAYKSRIEGLIASLTASINIKKYIARMSVLYICSVILGLLALITCIFTSLTNFITPLNILFVQLSLTLITLLPTVLRKP